MEVDELDLFLIIACDNFHQAIILVPMYALIQNVSISNNIQPEHVK